MIKEPKVGDKLRVVTLESIKHLYKEHHLSALYDRAYGQEVVVTQLKYCNLEITNPKFYIQVKFEDGGLDGLYLWELEHIGIKLNAIYE